MIVNKLHTILKQKKLTQEELAKAVGFTRQGLKNSFENETISVSKLVEVSDYLNVPINFWFDDEASAYKLRVADKRLIEAVRDFIRNEMKGE
jgi:transcriptional regulator with XRE-family HTH domain